MSCMRAAHPRPTADWLRQKYLTEQLSANDIAILVDRDPKTVWTWLKAVGVPTRHRGSNQGPQFKPGQPSAFKGKKHSSETIRVLTDIALADGRLPWGKGRTPYMRGRKGVLHHGWKGGTTPERQALYSSDEWKQAVVAVWHRDDAICRMCSLDSRLVPRRKRSFHVHHIKSFSTFPSLRTELSNLVLLCGPCHRFVHSRANTEKAFL